MEPTEDRYEVHASLLEVLSDNQDLADFLNDLAFTSAEHFSSEKAVLCGIVQERDKRNAVVASSSAEAAKMDELQAGFDEGPCLESHRTDTVIKVPDVRFEKRWPDYMEAVRDTSVRSILSMPLTVHGSARGAMNFYSQHVAAFDDDDIALAKRYAAQASKVIRIALRIAAQSELAEDRAAAMESRTAIDLAIGIIMGQNRCSQQEAFEILQRASNQRNIKLSVLSQELVTSVGKSAPTTSFEP